MAIIMIMSSSNSSNANRVSAYAIRRWERDFKYVCVYTYNACIYTYTILRLPSSLSSSLSSLCWVLFVRFPAPYRFSFVAGKPKRQLSAAIVSPLLDFRFDITEPDGCSESFARIEEREIIDDQIGGQGAGWKCMIGWE